MIYELQKELAAELEARGVPYPVLYGPESAQTTTPAVRSRIVLERDRKQGDRFDGPRSVHVNHQLSAVRAIGCVLRIYAASTAAGARVQDHERLADALLDRVTVALRKCVNVRKTLHRITAAKLLDGDELELRGLATWPGVVYELRFEIDRGVFDRDWDGSAAPEAAIGGQDGVVITSSTKVRLPGQDPQTSETSCGA